MADFLGVCAEADLIGRICHAVELALGTRLGPVQKSIIHSTHCEPIVPFTAATDHQLAVSFKRHNHAAFQDYAEPTEDNL